MTDKGISPLRRRMLEDMTIRKLAPKTQASYLSLLFIPSVAESLVFRAYVP